jgi:hypothetical protein
VHRVIELRDGARSGVRRLSPAPELDGMDGQLVEHAGRLSQPGALGASRRGYTVAEAPVEQFVPLGQLVIAALPRADHPDEAVMGGDGLVGGSAELPCRLGHVPTAGPAPFTQAAAIDPGHRAYLRVAVRLGSTAVLLDTPVCSQLSLSHDGALPVNWLHHVGTRW